MTLPQTPPFPCILLTFTNFVKEVSKLLTYISYLWFPTSTWFYSSLLDNISDLHCAKPNIIWASQVVLVVKNPPANAGDIWDAGSNPGLGRSPGEGNGNSLQYSCLENSMDREAWWAIVHRVAKSQTQLKWLSMHNIIYFSFYLIYLQISAALTIPSPE